MRLKTKIIIATVPLAAAGVAGVVIVAHKHLRRLRKREETSFLTDDVRNTLQKLCDLKGEDFVPDGLGTSLYQRRLYELTDRQLIGVYILIKVAEALRSRGTNLNQLSREQLLHEAGVIRNAMRHKQDRRELLRQLGSLSVDTARGVLADGLLIAQTAA